MKLERYLDQRQESWAELESLVARARGKARKLAPGDVLRLGALYRSAAADLSLGLRHFPRDPRIRRLQSLVLHARQLVYGSPGPGGRVIEFVSRGYWRSVAERPALVAVAAALLFGAAALAAAWAGVDRDAAAGLIPGELADAVSPGESGTDAGMGVAEQAAFSAALFTHNIQVTFLAFAAGITFTLGTALVLVYNGLILGAVGGILIHDGNGGFFVELVAAHGLLEPSCIVVAAAAGLRMGWALVDPGTRTRRAALQAESRVAVTMVLGTMPWLVVAGLLEAFVSRRGLTAAPAAVIGVVVGTLFWSLVWWRGRASQPDPHLRPQVVGGAGGP